jgi:hypothetical protein
MPAITNIYPSQTKNKKHGFNTNSSTNNNNSTNIEQDDNEDRQQ